MKISFSKDQILRMYPNVQYYVKNSNGGLLAGTVDLEEAKKYAEKYKKEYLKDSLNKHLGVYVFDKQGKNVYVAKGIMLESEETEEFEWFLKVKLPYKKIKKPQNRFSCERIFGKDLKIVRVKIKCSK